MAQSMAGEVVEEGEGEGEDKPRKAGTDADYPRPIYDYTWIIAATSFACGYGISSMGSAILYIPRSYPLTVLDKTAIFSMVLVGSLIGTFGSGYLSDIIGRRPVIILSGLVGAIAAGTSAITASAWQMIVARFVLGLTLGAASVLCGLFLAEASPAPIRGRLQGYGNLAGWFGGVFAYLISLLFIDATPDGLSWRLTLGLNALLFLPATIATACCLPESPRWLMSKNREGKAYRTLATIYGGAREGEMRDEYRNMQQGIYKRHSLEARRDSFFRAEYRKPLVLTFTLNILQQLSGNSMITIYSSIILSTLGFSDRTAVLVSGLSAIPQALIIWAVVHNLDRMGRRWPLLISIAGSGVSLIILATMVCLGAEHRACIWFSLTGIVLNRIFFSIGLGPLPSVVGAEVLPFAVRGRGLSAAMAVGEAVKIVAVTLFLPLTKSVHPAFIYGSLAFAMLLGFIYTLAQLKETKAKSLDLLPLPPPPKGPVTIPPSTAADDEAQ